MIDQPPATPCNPLATACNPLQPATPCNPLQPSATPYNLLQPSALLKSYHTKAKNSWFTFEYEGCKKVAKGCTDRFALGTRVAKRLQKVAKHHVIFGFCFEGIAHIIPWILGGITPTGTLPKKQQIQSYHFFWQIDWSVTIGGFYTSKSWKISRLRGLYGKPLEPLISSRGLYGKENRTVALGDDFCKRNPNIVDPQNPFKGGPPSVGTFWQK